VDLTSSPDGEFGYIGNANSGTIWEIDLEEMDVRRAVTAGTAPHGVMLCESRAFPAHRLVVSQLAKY
jgi:DNA-binding beta-propeller fold protein YncE